MSEVDDYLDNDFSEFDSIDTEEWENAMGEAVEENLDLSGIISSDEILDYTCMAKDVADALNTVINGPDIPGFNS